MQTSFASFIATVVECEVDKAGEVKLRRVTTAVDTGIAVNPDTRIAQLQGGHVFELTAPLYGEIALDKAHVQQLCRICLAMPQGIALAAEKGPA